MPAPEEIIRGNPTQASVVIGDVIPQRAGLDLSHDLNAGSSLQTANQAFVLRGPEQHHPIHLLRGQLRRTGRIRRQMEQHERFTARARRRLDPMQDVEINRRIHGRPGKSGNHHAIRLVRRTLGRILDRRRQADDNVLNLVELREKACRIEGDVHEIVPAFKVSG